MTTVKFALDSSGRITGFAVSGHSGYAEEGSDIVCAAVSAAVQMLELQIAQVIGEENASFTVSGEAEISWDVPENLTEKELIDPILNGFYEFMQSVSKHYEDFLTIETEVKKC